MKQHMLIIGGSREVNFKFKSLGIKGTLLFDISTVKYQRNLDFYERIIGIPHNAQLQEWIEVARTIHNQDPFNCISGFNELTQIYAAEVAKALGLKFHTPELIQITRQKDKMRETLKAAELDITKSCVANSIRDIETFVNLNGLPVILKPVDGRASLAISIIKSFEDIPNAVNRFKLLAPNHNMLCEQFIFGEEYSVEAFSENGIHRVISITQKFSDSQTFVETGHCIPAHISEDKNSKICTFIENILNAIELKDGPSHTEIIYTKSGPQIIETHARLGGDSIVELVRLAKNISLDELWILQISGLSVLNKLQINMKCFAAISFTTPHAIGYLERIDGISEAQNMPGVEKVEIYYNIGDSIGGQAQDSFGRVSSVIATGNTAEEATLRAQEAARKLRFIISCAGGN